MNNDRFKFRVWDNSDKEYIYFDFFSIKTEITYHKIGIIKKNIIEQCVGLKDKKGKLIYEGDIVHIAGDGDVIIDEKTAWELQERVYNGTYDDVEQIIGTIHD